jgi:iron complex transport system permease protein
MIAARFQAGPGALTGALATAALLACVALLHAPLQHLSASSSSDGSYDIGRMVLLYATLPRLAMALLCGAALAAAGAILQQVLGNVLASPTTLGVDSGARLALALVGAFLPDLFGLGRDVVAIVGSTISVLIVFALVRGRGYSAISIVLAGLIVSLYCGALAAIVTLVENRYLTSLFIWGSGSLSQQSWEPTIGLLWRLGLCALAALLLLRPLSLLEIGDEASRGLGLSVARIRVLAIGVAVLLSAFVTSKVGLIGFIGLAAPLLARLSGARTFSARLAWSSVIGALLLLLTDALVQLAANASAQFLPTGAVTAVLGSPLLLLLLPRLKLNHAPPRLEQAQASAPRPSNRIWMFAGLVLVALVVALLLGRDASGAWRLFGVATWGDVMPWRAPRFLASAAGGAALAAAGFILQRLTANALASPEVLGVSAGAMLAVALSLYVLGDFGSLTQNVAATLGGAVVLALILLMARNASFAPERVLLAGVALNTLIDAVVGVMTATGDPHAVMLLSWLGGSTSGITSEGALFILLATTLLVLLSLLGARWLAILPLGSAPAQALGVPLSRARLALFLVAAALTAVATPMIGPLTFVGLLAPHIVRSLGVRGAAAGLAASALVGAATMGLADFLARTIGFPLQLPTGLIAALVGAPFLLLLLFNSKTRVA